MRYRMFVPVALAVAFLASSCGSADAITINDPWARPTAPGAENAAFYLEIKNSGEADVLVGASSDRCTMTEVHATTMTDGVMSMAAADPASLTLQAGESLAFQPGGIHIMCMGIKAALIEGESISVQLQFAESDPITVRAGVEQRSN